MLFGPPHDWCLNRAACNHHQRVSGTVATWHQCTALLTVAGTSYAGELSGAPHIPSECSTLNVLLHCWQDSSRWWCGIPFSPHINQVGNVKWSVSELIQMYSALTCPAHAAPWPPCSCRWGAAAQGVKPCAFSPCTSQRNRLPHRCTATLPPPYTAPKVGGVTFARPQLHVWVSVPLTFWMTDKEGCNVQVAYLCKADAENGQVAPQLALNAHKGSPSQHKQTTQHLDHTPQRLLDSHHHDHGCDDSQALHKTGTMACQLLHPLATSSFSSKPTDCRIPSHTNVANDGLAHCKCILVTFLHAF